MTAVEKLVMIEAAIARGETVYLSTYTRVTKITPKVVARFWAAGRPVLKVLGDSLMLSEGRRYVCADYCAITTEPV